MAGAMLLYDEINRKGFEGDLVLNGLAEFIRNLLVCKDARAVKLLDVVEGMQQKYTETAAAAGLSFLISALNILNESEINFRMARNKRLHVELTLIKLNFLQQALELAADNGSLVKKKRLDGPVAYKTRSILSLQSKQATKGSAASAGQPQPSYEVPQSKLYIEEPPRLAETKPVTAAQTSTANRSTETITATSGPKTKKGLLDALREKYGDQYLIEEVKEPEILEMTKLRNVWYAYGEKLLQQEKHSASNTFRIATLEIVDDNFFTATVYALTQQKFIEQEKSILIDEIQKAFNNRSITFKVLIAEGEKEEVPAHLLLNSRQRLERIAEQYPLVMDLKNKLGLELDY